MIEKLKQEMERQGINARQLSTRAKLGSSFIYDLLSGRSANPTTNKMTSIADALGVSLSDLLSDTSNSNIKNSYGDFISVPLFINPHTEEILISDNYLFKEKWVIEHLKIMPENLRIVIVSGDGMHPIIHNGDLVLIDKSCTTPIKSGIFILSSNLSNIARRLEFVPGNCMDQVFITPDNPKYTAHTCNISDLQIIGRVVWISREL